MNETERILKAKLSYIAKEEAQNLKENRFYIADLMANSDKYRVNRLC